MCERFFVLDYQSILQGSGRIDSSIYIILFIFWCKMFLAVINQS